MQFKAKHSVVLAILLFTLAIGLLSPENALACPGCSEASAGAVSHGFNMSVLFLMGMPFFVAASVAVGIFVITRSKKQVMSLKPRKDSSNEIEEKES